MDGVSKKPPPPQFGLLFQGFLRQQEETQRERASSVSASEAVNHLEMSTLLSYKSCTGWTSEPCILMLPVFGGCEILQLMKREKLIRAVQISGAQLGPSLPLFSWWSVISKC